MIHPWTGEFRNAVQERRFRRHVRPRVVRQLRASLHIAALLFMLFGIADYALLGADWRLAALMTLRTVVAGVCVAVADAVVRRPTRAESTVLANIAVFVALTAVVLILPLRPATLETQLPAAMVVTMAVYLFVPNRVPWMVAQSLYLAVGFCLTAWARAPIAVETLLSLVLLFMLVNTVGYVTALRLAWLEREQFSALRDQRLANLRLRREVAERRQLQDKFTRLAQVDELTGLSNRRYFFEQAAGMLRKRRHGDRGPVVCMLDVDHFKAINDAYGHAAGDAVLTELARRCREVLREQDVMGRLGGEEFVVLLPQTDREGGLQVAERLRRVIEAEPVEIPGGSEPAALTVTIGVAALDDGEADVDKAILRADEALYRGKAAGRNRVVADAALVPA
ncbi:GGDEF domain-containing protein [Arhodomonas sp. SL1]|uniref:GGDEF domain-containing protein n=1 Tax=Arhodomonas sp. SL1 TaxID=3425691 RepID=UPI003F883D25